METVLRTPFDENSPIDDKHAGRWSFQEWADFCKWFSSADRTSKPDFPSLYREWFAERGAVQAQLGVVRYV